VKSFSSRLVEYLQEKDLDRASFFKNSSPEFFKKITNSFDDYTFYTGPSNFLDALIVISIYRDGNENPTFIFLKDALIEE